MGIVDKVLWFVETNLDNPVTLQGMADALGCNRFYMAHSFATLTGQPVMRYVWRRRLSRAAQGLVAGQDSILRIALDAGYASPEAFARAFRSEFGLSPRKLRQIGGLGGITLTQPLELPAMTAQIFDGPRFETLPARVYVGPSQRYDMQTRAQIPAQWESYNVEDIRAPSPAPEEYFGLVYDFTENSGSFAYMCGQVLTPGAVVPDGFAKLTVPAGRWAKFATKGHISTMQGAWGEIMNHWLSQPGCTSRSGPSIEFYPPEFDGMTGDGGYEIWMPVE